jgi:hypothetical protein
MEHIEWLKIQEELLKAQLTVIRGHLGDEKTSIKKERTSMGEGKSQMSIIIDILASAHMPLHVSEIIKQAQERYGLSLDRESMVSALTKKVKKGVMFVRSAPNTFGLKEQ